MFYEVRDVPVHSCLMMSSREEALNFPCEDVVLGFCNSCGFITNIEFDPHWSAYAPNSEDQQSFSPTFNNFARNLVQKLLKKYNLQGKNILEIGCSKGDFLLLLCELGNNYGVGIDPSVVPGRVESEAASRVKFIQDYYGEHHAEYVGDFICCRHTLEHIQPTAEFISTVRKSIGDRLVPFFLEIPDNTRVLKDLAFEDIYYEHCSYFSPGALARLFRACGFEVVDLYRDYGEQYLFIEALPTNIPDSKIHLYGHLTGVRQPQNPCPLEETVAEVAQDVRHFVSNIEAKLNYWKQYLEIAQSKQEKVVVWGSGSKCVAFLTTLDTADKIQYVVDINPHRHGRFIPGVGKQIMSPQFLQEYQPDRVIVMNSIYRDEIKQMLDEMNLSPEVIAL
ncbi:MAG: class I SAM-dependent methyltransferase [Pleurocapsa sp.]